MAIWVVAAVALTLSLLGYAFGMRQAYTANRGGVRFHSRPGYHGLYVAAWALLPALCILVLWLMLEPTVLDALLDRGLPAGAVGESAFERRIFIQDIKNLALGGIVTRAPSPEMQVLAGEYRTAYAVSRWLLTFVCAAAVVGGLWYGWRSIAPEFRARNKVEKLATILMIVASTIAVMTTAGIVFSLIFETIRFFGKISPLDFFFGLLWSPQTAIRADQVGAEGAFGVIPLLAGTLLITLIALVVAVPLGLFAAIYMSEYAGKRTRAVAKPVLEILAGIPTVVYGFFAALTVAPFFRGLGESVGLDVASESALAAGVVMGIMIIPFVSSLSDDVMNAVPQSLRDGSYAMGATQSETIKQVILPAALPGIVGAVLLAASRAIGETMIVVMAAGLAANLTINPLNAVTTITVQIVTLLTGDQEFESAKTLAAFALGMTLFVVTLCLNVFALHVVRKYREKYD